MDLTLIEQLAAGGHLWRAKEKGGHVVLPCGTPFHVCEAGSGHRVLATGTIREGGFQMDHGPDGGRVIDSGNEAVMRVKRNVVSANAFRHLHLRLCGQWRSADEVREDGVHHLDGEVLALLDEDKRELRSRRTGQIIRCDRTLTRLAAERLMCDPEAVHRRIEMRRELMVWLDGKLKQLGVRP